MTFPKSLAAVTIAWLTGCGGAEAHGWTEQQAEAIRSVRGMPVHVLECRGLGSAREGRFTRFACLAGARRSGENYDTVGVSYDLVLLENAGYRLEKITFIGGPGIP